MKLSSVISMYILNLRFYLNPILALKESQIIQKK